MKIFKYRILNHILFWIFIYFFYSVPLVISYGIKSNIFINLVYIGRNGRKSEYGLEVFIKHELSHLLLHQNLPQKKDAFEIQNQGWLMEGIATYFGGPNYYQKEVHLW